MIQKKIEIIPSVSLNRTVKVHTVFPSYSPQGFAMSILILNDGQDLQALKVEETLVNFWKQGGTGFLLAAVETGAGRLQEYGTKRIADFAGRGALAENYQSFILNELFPLLGATHELSRGNHLAAGCSLGGLAAFDMALENPEVFSAAGVFSGAFWWRSKDLVKGYSDDKHRIMHQKVRKQKLDLSQRFWFQCGSEDELSDRNKNGVIDSIDDTRDLIKELEKKGLQNVAYYEMSGGKHDQDTWSQAFPHFIRWAFK